MPRIERHIGLGWTADRFRVVATLTLETPEPGAVATFTDHTTGPAPERISVSWEALKYRGTSREEGSAGQVPSEDRVIARRAVAGQNGYNYSDADAETAAFIDAVWRDWHLNDMNAACDHMTPDALNPDAETLAAYRAEKTAERGEWREKTAERGEWREKYSPAFYGDADALQKYRLDHVTCPETDYRYGHSWLARTVPADILERFRTLVENGAPQ